MDLCYNIYDQHGSLNVKEEFIDTFVEIEPQLKCGEIVLSSNRNVCFSCNFCERQFHHLDTFLQHILKQHLLLTNEDTQNMLQEAKNVDSFENYMLDENISNDVKDNIHTQGNSLTALQNDIPTFQDLQDKTEESFCHFEELLSESSSIAEETNINTLASKINDTKSNSCESLEVLEESSEEYSPVKHEVDNDLVQYEIEVLHDLAFTHNAAEISEEVECIPKKTQKSAQLSSIKTFVCTYCDKTYKNNALLTVHMKRHATKKAYACEYCDARFTDNCNLKVHINRHLGIKPHGCSLCQKSFTSTTELKLHMRSHTGEKPYVCEECGQRFSSSGHLKAHRRRHYNERPFKCETCGKDFYDRKLLRNHEVAHSSERPFSCDICNTTFTRYKALVEHKKLHSGVRSYECKICKKSFAQNAGLWAHMKQNHGPFKNSCDKMRK